MVATGGGPRVELRLESCCHGCMYIYALANTPDAIAVMICIDGGYGAWEMEA